MPYDGSGEQNEGEDSFKSLSWQSRQSYPASVQSIWGSRKDYLYDIVNTVSTRRGTARNAIEDNCAVGQNSDEIHKKMGRIFRGRLQNNEA